MLRHIMAQKQVERGTEQVDEKKTKNAKQATLCLLKNVACKHYYFGGQTLTKSTNGKNRLNKVLAQIL